jgi:hypothetical protein
MGKGRAVTFLVIAAAVVIPGSLQASRANDEAPAGIPALEQGFRFASAIQTDDDSKGKAQLAIVLALAEIGALDLAVERVDAVTGWYRGVGYAELATLLAREGRAAEAETLIARATQVEEQTSGWQGPRISVFIGRAMAALGNVEGSREAVEAISDADPRQYSGQATATVASGYAQKGDFEAAMETLKSLDGSEGAEVAHWLTRGYLGIAEAEELETGQRLEALAAADRSANLLSGPPRVKALRSISEHYEKLGKPEKAADALQEARKTMEQSTPGDLSSSMTMTKIARTWVTLGESDRARALLKESEATALRRALTDRPALLAEIAVAYAANGDDGEYHRVLQASLDMTDRVTNARPRALAAVAICRALGWEQLRLDDQTVERLDGLYDGLGDPW